VNNTTRYWSAIGQCEGLEPFYFGSVLSPLDARMDEVETALTISWATVFPFCAPPHFTVTRRGISLYGIPLSWAAVMAVPTLGALFILNAILALVMAHG
jgi:hypothetical protein